MDSQKNQELYLWYILGGGGGVRPIVHIFQASGDILVVLSQRMLKYLWYIVWVRPIVHIFQRSQKKLISLMKPTVIII